MADDTARLERLKQIDNVVTRMKLGHGLYGRDEIQALLDEIANLSSVMLQRGLDRAALQEQYDRSLATVGMYIGAVGRVHAQLDEWQTKAAAAEPAMGRQVISVEHIVRTLRPLLEPKESHDGQAADPH